MQELSRASEGVRGHARKCEDVQPSVRAYECVRECASHVQNGLKRRETVKTSRKPVNYTGRKHLDGEGGLNQNSLVLIVTQGQLSPSQAPGVVQSRDVVTHTFAVCCCNLPL